MNKKEVEAYKERLNKRQKFELDEGVGTASSSPGQFFVLCLMRGNGSQLYTFEVVHCAITLYSKEIDL